VIKFAKSVYRPSNDIDCIVSINNMSWSNLHLETSLQVSDYNRGRILQPAHRENVRRRKTWSISEHDGHGMTRCQRDPLAIDPLPTFLGDPKSEQDCG
jgi:hypothetical protein